MFASRPSTKGTIVFTDTPLVSIQHTANRRFINACQNCHRLLGGVKDQLGQIFAEERFQNVELTILGSTPSAPVYNCHCGEMYCSTDCAEEAYKKHHRYLCVAGQHGEAVAEFKFHCLAVEGSGDNLLLLVQLMAVLESRSNQNLAVFEKLIQELMTYTNRPFDEVARPPHGQERDTEWRKWLSETILESFRLLKRALVPQSPIFAQFFSHETQAFDICSRILSIFELNNIDIAIPTGLGFHLKSIYMQLPDAKSREQFVNILREKEVIMQALWSDEARGIYEDEEEDEEEEMDDSDEYVDEENDDCCSDHMHEDGAIEEMLNDIRRQVNELSIDDLLTAECPDFHGSGFYLTVARTNHSCSPNVTMEFENFNSLVSCKTLRDIPANEELRMSYISVPESKSVRTRRNQLRDYLFECECERCEAESSSKKFNAM